MGCKYKEGGGERNQDPLIGVGLIFTIFVGFKAFAA